MDRIPPLEIMVDNKKSDIGLFIVQGWRWKPTIDGDTEFLNRIVRNRFMVDEDTPATAKAAAVIEMLIHHGATEGVSPHVFLTEAFREDGAPLHPFHDVISVGRSTLAGLEPDERSAVLAEIEVRCAAVIEFLGYKNWPKDFAVSRPDLAQHLTQTIRDQIDEWLAEGQIETVRDVGDGLCYDFAEGIAKRLGLGGREGYGPISMRFTEEFCEDDAASYELLTEAGEIAPTDIPFDKFAVLIDRATHQWIEFGGRHYDATAPEGVDRFLELPFFANQINQLRSELKMAPA